MDLLAQYGSDEDSGSGSPVQPSLKKPNLNLTPDVPSEVPFPLTKKGYWKIGKSSWIFHFLQLLNHAAADAFMSVSFVAW